ncbi:hypothetical protein [Candidatus Vampirococcus lugosii]|uniref:Uncharacterized protein n=1 Tax=Candidatus Vampirococcus lugosii TaxID=2789015 RepID=A0ABS5QJK7_9BACT|nr:hypothetical protein [Candidatus Vampirococcus lugosii]MBS8121456.1 hypothetical protein [Candidatus Vampirococcus lugosii]
MSKFLKIGLENIFILLFKFSLGLSIFLIIIYILMVFNLLYSYVSLLIFFGFIAISYLQKDDLLSAKKIIENKLFSLNKINFEKDKFNYILSLVLIIVSISYIYFGFVLSYIPYPTAWDANHAYMFYPKMWALNNGYYWDEGGMSTRFQLWYSYITYWFSLSYTIVKIPLITITADTIAIVTNFFSGVFVLLFSLSLFREVLDYLKSKFPISDNSDLLIFNTSWLLILLWLTSGMGAFLVFVDNKTDLGVMTFITMAIYSGFVAIKYMQDNFDKNLEILEIHDLEDLEKEKEELEEKKKNKIYNSYLFFSLSGFMFAMAVMSKPTAFLDAVGFGLLLMGIWIGAFAVLGAFIMILGILSLVEFRGIKDYISSQQGYLSMVLGFGLVVFNFAYIFINKSFKYIFLFLFWGISFIFTLLILKGTYVFYVDYSKGNDFEAVKFIERVFLSQSSTDLEKDLENNKSGNTEPVLFASTNNPEDLYNGINSCSLSNLDNKDSLYENISKAPGDTYAEDVGRYIGYGQRKFKYPWWGIFFPSGNKCMGFNSSSNLVCANLYDKNHITYDKISYLYNNISSNSKVYDVVSNIYNSDDFSENISNKDIINTFSGEIQELEDFYKDNSILREDYTYPVINDINELTYEKILNLYNNVNSGSRVYDVLYSIVNDDNRFYENISNEEIIKNFSSEIQELKELNISVDNIHIPYKYLVPFNITFNWSLSNESSYYTDIGYIWLIILFTLIFAILYAIAKFDRYLLSILFVTLLLWTIWFFIGGGILWYGLGLILWTILGFISFLYRIGQIEYNDKNKLLNIYIYFFLVYGFFMLLLNFIRIQEQGGSGPFMWYKQGIGQEQTYNESGKVENNKIMPYTSDDVFDRQFGHYYKFLNLVNNRDKSEGVYIAGTYARYFVDNQKYIKYDQFLTWLWEMFSDNDTCNSYLRLKDQKMDYLAIDPNIGTVVMGQGNMSLFDRFFAKLDSNGKIEEHGAISMLAKLIEDGYIEFVSSNNIGAKYGFILSQEELEKYIGQELTDDELVLLRARLATLRYWNSEQLYNIVLNAFTNRLESFEFIDDVVSIYGKNIETHRIKEILKNMLENPGKSFEDEITNLSDDEKEILFQVVNIYNIYLTDQEQYKSVVIKLIKDSIGKSSQIIVFKLK